MPTRGRKYCMKCSRIATQGSYCDEHAPARDYKAENRRRTTAMYDSWYKLPLWQAIRARQLRREPLCVECMREGIYNVEATEVDHVEPHKGDWSKFIDDDNLQSLCKSHHSRKTAKERRGRFGNNKSHAKRG